MSLFWEVGYFASEVEILVLELDFLFIIFEKLFSDQKNVSSFLSRIFCWKLKKVFPDFQIKKEKM